MVLQESCVTNDIDENKNTISLLAELYGPVVTDPNSKFFMGATVQTNNTGELTAVGEGILWLILNLPKICSSVPTPLTHIVVHSDSDYAIKTCEGMWSGDFNVELYSQVRQYIVELHACIGSLKIDNSLTRVPSFSFNKVEAHAGVEGNERADILAKRGQLEVCNIGRYSAILVNSLPSPQHSISSPNKIDEKNSVSLNNISKILAEMDLDDSETKYETTNNHNFSETNLNSQSTTLGLDQSSLPSSASSSPWVYPLGLVDYDKM